MKTILLAVPSYTGMIPLKVMSRLMALDKPEGYMINFAYTERTFIDHARNQIIRAAVEHKEDYVLFCDDDQIPPHDVIMKLLAVDQDIVGAPIPNRRGKHILNVFNDDYENINDFKGVQRVGAIGCGIMLIRREVLVAMLTHYKKPFEFKEVEHNGKLKEFSEDVMFCKRARGLGFQVWCEGTIETVHLGDQVQYSYRDGEYIRAVV